jgi:uncharacterized integral membrane protein
MNIDQYLNIDGINPKVWGKCGWTFLSSIALVYNPKKKIGQKENYKNFFTLLPKMLPCENCGENLEKAIPELDEALVNNKKLLEWLLKIRNSIYEEEGRKKMTMKEMIIETFNSNNSNTHQYVWIIVMVLVLILLIFILRYYNPNNK